MPIGSTLNGLKTLPRENIPPTTKIVRKAATEEDKEQVRDMWKNGLSANEISKETGFAIATVYNWCKGISNPNKQNNGQVDEETKEKAKSLYISGMAVARISEEIGVSKRSIFTWIKKYGWEKKEKKEMVEQEKVEQTKVEISYPSPYKAFKVDDINICHKYLDKATTAIADIYNTLNGIDSFNAYKLGEMSVYIEMVKEILNKED